MADSPYDIRPGGSLKLKKSGDQEGKKKKKSSKSKEKEKELLKAKLLEEQKKIDAGSGEESSARNSPMPGSSAQAEGAKDNRTDAERRFEETQRKRRAERVAKMASMTHKDRVSDFNKKLEALSEHHDIPRVGPG